MRAALCPALHELSELPSEVRSGHQWSSVAAAALDEFGMAAAARCVVRRAEPLVHTATAHRRRRCPPLALPLNLPLDLPHGHQRDDLLPLRGATARLRAERMRGGLSHNQSQSVAISRNQPQSAAISRNQSKSIAISRNQSQSEGSQRSACHTCMPQVHACSSACRRASLQASSAGLTRIASRKTACLYWSSVWSSVRCRMYERIETTNAPAQQVNPRYAHSAKGGPRRAAASAEKGICLRAERRRGQSVAINRTRAGGVGREGHTSIRARRDQSPSTAINRHLIALKSASIAIDQARRSWT